MSIDNCTDAEARTNFCHQTTKKFLIFELIAVGSDMKKLSEIKSLLELHQQSIKEKYNVRQLGIFGSIARDEATEFSDVDILVELEKPIGLDFVLLGDELEDILGVKVDIVTPNALKPKMFDYIKQDLIYV